MAVRSRSFVPTPDLRADAAGRPAPEAARLGCAAAASAEPDTAPAVPGQTGAMVRLPDGRLLDPATIRGIRLNCMRMPAFERPSITLKLADRRRLTIEFGDEYAALTYVRLLAEAQEGARSVDA